MQQLDAKQVWLGVAIGAGLLVLGLGALSLVIQLLPVIVVVGGTYIIVKSVVGGEDLG